MKMIIFQNKSSIFQEVNDQSDEVLKEIEASERGRESSISIKDIMRQFSPKGCKYAGETLES